MDRQGAKRGSDFRNDRSVVLASADGQALVRFDSPTRTALTMLGRERCISGTVGNTTAANQGPPLPCRDDGLLMQYLASPTSAGKSESQAQSFPSPQLTLISCLSFASNCDSSASGLSTLLSTRQTLQFNPVPFIPRQSDPLIYEDFATESGQFDHLHSHHFLICPVSNFFHPTFPFAEHRRERNHDRQAHREKELPSFGPALPCKAQLGLLPKPLVFPLTS